MIGRDAEPPVPPASRAESACASPMGASRSSPAAAPPNVAMYGARQALLSRHRAGLVLSACLNLPADNLRALRAAISGPAAAPLSP